MYDKIIDPFTNKTFKIDSSDGKEIIKKYSDKLIKKKKHTFRGTAKGILASIKLRGIENFKNRVNDNLPTTLELFEKLILKGLIVIDIENNKAELKDDKIKLFLEENQIGGSDRNLKKIFKYNKKVCMFLLNCLN